MSYLQAILLGLIQGLTEFLPISSSAHLKVARSLMGISGDDVVFDLACHFGTVIALIYFFRHDISSLLFKDPKKLRFFIIALLPLVPVYFLLKPVRDWASNLNLLGFFLLVTSLLLFLGGKVRIRKPRKSASLLDVFWIGVMQAAALIPGISRSASTISTARVLGWSAREAVRFSFLLAIPAILGGMSLEGWKVLHHTGPAPTDFGLCTAGFIAALSSGLAVVSRAITFLERGNLRPFAWYCLFAGLTSLLVF
jgi:undecaprenyl-diphosphatase